MAEIPLVVVDVQRGGPATGLPTKTEQSDLMACMYPAHGDVRMPVIAPGSVEECFFGAVHAFNWSERYQGPVILMSEMSMAERVQNIPRPNLSKTAVENRLTYEGSNGYHRYSGNELSPMPLPGHPGAYVANGSEHDEMGDTTHLASRHIQMTERRFSKLKLLEEEHYESATPTRRSRLCPGAAPKGRCGKRTMPCGSKAWMWAGATPCSYNPIPPKLLEELRSKDLVIVPELNYQASGRLYCAPWA